MTYSPHRRTFSNSHFEADGRDIVISQLKAEAFELRQEERDYEGLQSRFNNMNHRLNLLQDEKVLDGREHNSRHEANERTIINLKQEVEGLRSQFGAIESDVQDARAENQRINGVISDRNNEIAKHKLDLSELYNDQNELTLQKKELERQIANVQNENKEHVNENADVNYKVEEANERKAKNERLIRQLENDVEKCLRLNDDLKAQQNELKAQIRDKLNAIKNAEQALSDNNKRIICLESRLSDRKRVNEKLHNDISVSQRELREESIKAGDSTAQIRQLENLLSEKEDEIEDLRRQVQDLRKDQMNLIDQNDNLVDDIKGCYKQYDSLTVQHYELIDEVEKVNQEDAEIRSILQRVERVQATAAKHQTTSSTQLRVSTVKGGKQIAESPVRTASTRDEN